MQRFRYKSLMSALGKTIKWDFSKHFMLYLFVQTFFRGHLDISKLTFIRVLKS